MNTQKNLISVVLVVIGLTLAGTIGAATLQTSLLAQNDQQRSTVNSAPDATVQNPNTDSDKPGVSADHVLNQNLEQNPNQNGIPVEEVKKQWEALTGAKDEVFTLLKEVQNASSIPKTEAIGRAIKNLTSCYENLDSHIGENTFWNSFKLCTDKRDSIVEDLQEIQKEQQKIILVEDKKEIATLLEEVKANRSQSNKTDVLIKALGNIVTCFKDLGSYVGKDDFWNRHTVCINKGNDVKQELKKYYLSEAEQNFADVQSHCKELKASVDEKIKLAAQAMKEDHKLQQSLSRLLESFQSGFKKQCAETVSMMDAALKNADVDKYNILSNVFWKEVEELWKTYTKVGDILHNWEALKEANVNYKEIQRDCRDIGKAYKDLAANHTNSSLRALYINVSCEGMYIKTMQAALTQNDASKALEIASQWQLGAKEFWDNISVIHASETVKWLQNMHDELNTGLAAVKLDLANTDGAGATFAEQLRKLEDIFTSFANFTEKATRAAQEKKLEIITAIEEEAQKKLEIWDKIATEIYDKLQVQFIQVDLEQTEKNITNEGQNVIDKMLAAQKIPVKVAKTCSGYLKRIKDSMAKTRGAIKSGRPEEAKKLWEELQEFLSARVQKQCSFLFEETDRQ